MAEKAKAALVTLAAVKPPVFREGFGLDLGEGTPLEKGSKAHVFRAGLFTIDVENRTYHAQIREGGWTEYYDGNFTVDGNGRWTALKPKVTFSDVIAKPK